MRRGIENVSEAKRCAARQGKFFIVLFFLVQASCTPGDRPPPPASSPHGAFGSMNSGIKQTIENKNHNHEKDNPRRGKNHILLLHQGLSLWKQIWQRHFWPRFSGSIASDQKPGNHSSLFVSGLRPHDDDSLREGVEPLSPAAGREGHVPS